MKNKIIFMMLLMLATIKSYSQEYVIEHCVEDRTFKSPNGLICSNEDRDKWFFIQFIYKANTNYPMVDGFRVLKTNIGVANGIGDLMVFTFTDRTTIKVKARTSQLEDLSIEFNLTNKDLDVLLNNSVVSIRYINGSDYKSYTYYTMDTQNVFFYNALKFYRLKRINCE